MPPSRPKILLLGAGGQLGRELLFSLAPLGQVLGAIRQPSTKPELQGCRILDVRDGAAVTSVLHEFQPTVVVNAAAYTAVDQAETDVEIALQINGRVVGLLAEECGKLGMPLIHYSTDYVFDGRGSAAWSEVSAASGNAAAFSKSSFEGFFAT